MKIFGGKCNLPSFNKQNRVTKRSFTLPSYVDVIKKKTRILRREVNTLFNLYMSK